jgi:hypothetical protein
MPLAMRAIKEWTSGLTPAWRTLACRHAPCIVRISVAAGQRERQELDIQFGSRGHVQIADVSICSTSSSRLLG